MNVRTLALALLIFLGLICLGSGAVAQEVQIKGPKNGSAELSGTTYGPVTPSDTLWRIASRYRQNKNLSVYQVMQGIYQLNPEAFDDNNFNHLIDGSILNLPSERYIARIDPEQARLKAENDDASWPGIAQQGDIGAAISKPSGVASKDDLSETKQVIEEKLTELDAQQNRQFMAIRKQFAESINSVQSLLNENKKLLERLDGVDQDIADLRGRVDVEIQTQMDQMLELQNELLAISRDAESQRRAESQKSSLDWLTDPITLIALTVLLSLSLLAGFALWLVRRNSSSDTSEMTLSDDQAHAASLEQSDEMDDLADALSDELSDDLSDSSDDDLFADEELLDDVLSEELKESLDEREEDLENFDDLGDENLEPIVEESTDSEDGLLEQEDLDSLFDEEDELLAQIDEDPDEETSPEPPSEPEPEPEAEPELTDDVDELVAAAPVEEDPQVEDPIKEDEPEAKEISSVVEDEEKPEISIDELLEQPEIELPDSVLDADADSLDDEMLQNLDKEIASQNNQLDKMTDNLLNEIEQLEQMGGLLDGLEDESEEEVPESNESSKQHAIQELDEVAEGIEQQAIEDIAFEETQEDETQEDENSVDDIESESVSEALSTDDVQVSEDASEEADKQASEDFANEVLEDFQSEDISSEDESQDPLASLDDDIPTLSDVEDEFNDKELEEALKTFDEDVIDSDFLDDEGAEFDSESNVELDDLPGLGDWLTEDSKAETAEINELENSSFDELLDGIEDDIELPESSTSAADEKSLDDSGLDFDALLTDIDSMDSMDSDTLEKEVDESKFVDVEDLISESEQEEEQAEKKLDLESAFGSHEKLSEEDMVDVDGDQGIGAKLDLAQAYLETEEIDAAIPLLEDVLDKGDEAQQREAQELLSKLPE